MRETIKDQIIEQVNRLAEPERRRLLNFARLLTSPAGAPGRNFLHFAGAIDPSDLELMSQAILEGCEKVDRNAW